MASTSKASPKRKNTDKDDSPNKRMKNGDETKYQKLSNLLIGDPSIHKELLDVLNKLNQPEKLKESLKPNRIQALHSSLEWRSVIITAVKEKCWKLVEVLVTHGVNTSFRVPETGETLSDIVCGQQEYEVLAKILNADGPFPESVNEKILIQKSRIIEDAVTKRNNLHDLIKSGNIEQIKAFIKSNPGVKHGYRAKNLSALSSALLNKKFKIYSLLCSEGFKSGVDKGFEKLEDELKSSDREAIKNFNRKYFKRPINIHIFDLVRNSRPAFGSESPDFSTHVMRLFETLDSIPGLRPILKLVAESGDADIVFDYNCESVCRMDPTSNANTCGLTYPSGYILIGAKRASDDERLGTLVHELMHYAMQLVCENECLPFCPENLLAIKKFKDLVASCQKIEKTADCNEIISKALSFKDINRIIGELIVRPAQLMALYKDVLVDLYKVPSQELKKVSETYKVLFDAFKDALKEIESTILVLKPQKSVQKLNRQLGVFNKYHQSKIFCVESKRQLQNFSVDRNLLIRSQVPDLVASNLIKHLKATGESKIDSKYVFTDFETLSDSRFENSLCEVLHCDMKPKLIITSSIKNEFDAKKYQGIIENYNIQNEIVLITNTDASFSAASFPSQCVKNFNWVDLDMISKNEIVDSRFKIHEQRLNLRYFYNIDSLNLQEEPLVNILNLVNTSNLDEKLPSPLLSFSIERRFKIMAAGRFKTLSKENVADLIENNRAVIIADVAGMGKSTSALEIANSLTNISPNWVAFIDLKKHTEKFRKDSAGPCAPVDVTFFSEGILKLEAEQKFLFESFYHSKNVFFIIDGFDEISPSYKNYIMKVLSVIKDGGNCLLVTTRVHLRSDLEKHLETVAIRLLPLSEDERESLVAKYWVSNAPDTRETVFKSKAKQMLTSIQKSFSKKKRSEISEFFGIPQHVIMLAEISNNHDKETDFNFNVFDLYDKFVRKKLANCQNHGGPLAEADFESLSDFNKFKVYHKAALLCFFDNKTVDALKFPRNLTALCDERISSQGLFRAKDGEKSEFLHHTYAEFFVADFIMKQLQEDLLSSSLAFHDLFLKVLLNEKFDNVRNFLNEKLALQNSTFHTDQLRTYLQRKVEIKGTVGFENRRLLHLTVIEDQIELLNFILSRLDCLEPQKKFEILTRKSKALGNTLHLAIHGTGKKSFEALWNWIENSITDKNLYKLLTLQGPNKQTILTHSKTMQNNELSNLIVQISKRLSPPNLHKFCVEHGHRI